METQQLAKTEIDCALREREQIAPNGTALRESYLVRHRDDTFERFNVEQFIALEYYEHFDANVTEFMPTLVSLHSAKGALKAAVGYRAAAEGPLFLECYTNGPIEQVIARQAGFEVSRQEIVEVGSLACNGGRAAMEMVQSLIPVLIEDGFTWVVFTGADTVRNVFRRLHMTPIALCIANKSVLGPKQAEWGSYYEHNPVVMAGPIAAGVAALDSLRGGN